MTTNWDATKTALRVLTEVSQGRVPDPADVAELSPMCA